MISRLALLSVAVSLATAAPAPPPLVCRPGEMASDALHIANFTLDAAAAWCRNSSRCAGFGAAVPYPGGCNTTAVVEAHFADGWGARRPNHDLSWTNWLVPGPRPQPPPPPYTPPPNPCLAGGEGSPKYHIMNMGIPAPHDLNSVFHYKGTWHVMHQANWSDWAHLVSTDLAHWTRIESALSPNGDWDGALTILDGKPVIMYDCYNVADCKPLQPGTSRAPATVPVLGDPAIVGVARPSDYNDPNLTSWEKDPANPIVIHGAGKYAGPGTLWKEGSELRFLMPLNSAIGMFGTSDASLHEWNVTTESFYPNSSGPSLFFPIPGNAPAGLSHVLGGVAPPKPHPAGTAWYTLGQYHAGSGTFNNTTPPAPFDGSDVLVFAQLHVDDGRMLFMGWWNPCDSARCHGALTVPREVSFDEKTTRLMSLPAPELSLLREATLGGLPATAVAAGKSFALFGQASNAFDLVMNVTLPARGGASFAIALMASGPDVASVTLQVNVSLPSAAGLREVLITGKAQGFASMAFAMPDMDSMDVRVLADRTLAEVFVAEGRGVVTVPVSSAGNQTRAFITAGANELNVESTAWEMGCGWAAYP